MSSVLCAQISDHRLDLYALGRLPQPEVHDLEQHLLTCESCCQRLTATDQFIAALRSASAILDPDAPAPRKPVVLSRTRTRSRTPLMLAAAALLLVSLVPVFRTRWRSARPVVEAVLLAVRGGEPGGLVQVARARTTILNLDLAEMPDASEWYLTVVNSRGVLVWNVKARGGGELLRFRIDRPLEPGNYWVRLHDAAAPADLLREYGFRVR